MGPCTGNGGCQLALYPVQQAATVHASGKLITDHTVPTRTFHQVANVKIKSFF